MKLDFALQAFYYKYADIINKAKQIGKELDLYLSNNIYMSNIALDAITLNFVNTEALKCRKRPDYRATSDLTKEMNFNVMTLFYEIPIIESEFVVIPETEITTFLGKALLEVLETQNVPVKIRKNFDRERFISDVRDFFVNVKGCQL